MNDVRQALKMQREAQLRRALAPDYDPVRRDFDLELADEMVLEAQALLAPCKPLQTGLGGEIIPPAERGLSGLELVLKEPDLLNLGASEQRANLLERNGVLELGIETAHDAQANGSIQKMISQQTGNIARGGHLPKKGRFFVALRMKLFPPRPPRLQ